MTITRAWALIIELESRGNTQAIGDDGRAGGLGQMWWVFRKDYWPPWAWNVLAELDYIAFRTFVRANPALNLRELYNRHYDPGSQNSTLPEEFLDSDS